MGQLKDFFKNPIQIIQEPDPRLRIKSSRVLFEPIADLIKLKQLMLFLMTQDRGIGLAAPQIGLNLRIILILHIQGDLKTPLFMINPEIISKSGSTCIEEGCLSIKGQKVEVPRAEQVVVKYQDEHSQNHQITLNDINAICVQHEIDHLDGILMTDYL